MKGLSLVLFGFFLGFCACGQIKSKRSPTMDLDKKIPVLMQEADIAGLSIAVIKNGEIHYLNHFGLANTATAQPVNANTVFEAASLGKPVFGYLILKLADQGVLDLDKPLSHYVKDNFNEERRKIAGGITARMVLSHTTGLPNTQPGKEPLRFAFNPGQKFSYSGEGMLLLQQVVEHLTLADVETLMVNYVFKPLHMRYSSFGWRPEYDSLKAYGHNELMEVAGRGKPLSAQVANSFHTTVADYAKFMLAALKGTGLKKETFLEMVKSQVSTDPSCVVCLTPTKENQLSPRLSWGLGWGIEKEKADKWIWHWGDNVTYQGFASGNPINGDAVIYFSNSSNGLSVAGKLVNITMGFSPQSLQWLGYTPYNTPIKKKLKAITLNREKKVGQVNSGSYLNEFNIDQLNWLGQQLLNRRMYQEALDIFSVSLSRDYASLPAQSGMGEGYLKLNNKTLALKHLKLALALAPQNTRLSRKINLLEKPEIKLDAGVAQSYLGQYKSALGVLTISKKENTLFVQLEGNPPEELLPEARDLFISADAGVQLHFHSKKAGQSEIELTAGTEKFIAVKKE